MASISKRRTTKGEWRWDVRWRVDGKPKERAFRRAKDAETFKRQVESDELKGLTIDPSRGRIPFAEYAEGWMVTRRRVDGGRPLAPRTIELYRYILNRWLLPEFATVALTAIRSDRVRIWHGKMAEDGSPLQAAKAYRLLSVILNTAVGDERITRNPCILRGRGRSGPRRRPFVDAEVVLRLADAIDQRYRALVLLAGFGGLRLGELLALRTQHLDLDTGWCVRGPRRRAEGWDTVGHGPQDRRRHPPGIPAGGRDPGPGGASGRVRDGPAGLLFTGPLSDGLRRRRPTRSGSGPQGRRLPTVHLHDLRHAAGTLAAQTGATLREVMARLGHASPAAAQRYQHAAERRDRVIAEALDVILDAAEQSRKATNGPGPRDGRGMEPELDPLPGGPIHPKVGPDQDFLESERRESNSRSAWEADFLPLNYARNGPVRYRGRDAGVPIGGPRLPSTTVRRVILSDRTIREELAAGRIVIDPLDEGDIQPSSVDLRVDRYFRVFRNHTQRVIDVKDDQEELTELLEVGEDDSLILHPGEFILGSTLERVAPPRPGRPAGGEELCSAAWGS